MAPEHVGVVFDMDGTLINTSTLVPDAFIAALAEAGVAVRSRSEIIARYSFGPPATLLSHFLGREATADELHGYHEHLGRTASSVEVFDGIGPMLTALADGGARLAVFTGASHQAASILLTAAGLADRFEHVVGGDQVPASKPDPAGLLLAFSLLGLNPTDGFYVGDAPTDIETARRAAVQPVAAGWGHLFDRPDGVPTAHRPMDVVSITNH